MSRAKRIDGGGELPLARRVIATAPVRADLAGGTLDLWPLGLLQRGAVTVAVAVGLEVSAAIGPPPRRGRASMRTGPAGKPRLVDLSRPLRASGTELLERLVRALAPAAGASIETASPVRRGSGLGTSSAMGVAIAAGLARAAGRKMSARRIVELVRDVEAQILGIPTGTQDHWAAWSGGAVICRHEPGGPEVRRLSGDVLGGLAERLLVIDSGEGRSSGPSNWDMYRRAIDADPAALVALQRVARAGRLAAEGLDSGDFVRLGRAMRADHAARADWSPLVTTERLEAIIGAALAEGALGAKVCGAGGGGFAVALARDARQRVRIACAVEEAGGLVSSAGPSRRGARVRLAPRGG